MAYGHRIYTKLSDFINRSTYPIEAPLYAADKHIAIENGEIEPLHIPDKNAKGLSRVTIALMIDYCDKVIPFKILKDDDLIEIYSYLDEYIRQLQQFTDIDEAKDYLDKAKVFYNFLTRSMKILSKRNSKALDALGTNSVMGILERTDRIKGRKS